MEATGAGAGLGPSGGRIRPGWLAWGVLVLAVAACFGRVVQFGFVEWDDPWNVTANPLLAPPDLRNLARIWGGWWTGYYIPASGTFFWIEARLSSVVHGEGVLDPHVFHAGLFLLHLGCALLVLRLLSRLVPPGSGQRGPLLGALLFACHPLQAESVAWVTETRGVLASLFGVLALERHVAASSAARGRASVRLEVAATIAFALALLAKPSVAAVPAIAFLLDRFVLGRPLRRLLPPLFVWIAMAVALLAATKSQQTAETMRFETPAWARPLVALDALGFYLEKLASPFRLAIDYGRKPAWLLEHPARLLNGLVPLALLGALLLLPGRRTWIVALGVFAAALLPVLGIASFHFQDISTVADRYVHLALLGPAFALAAGLSRPGAGRLAAPAAIALAALGFLAWRQAGVWSESERLFRHALEVNPRSRVARTNLAVIQSMRGQKEEAARAYRAVLELEPNDPVARDNLGLLLLEESKFDEAIELFRGAVQDDPRYPFARTHLALALIRSGRMDEAEPVLREALRVQPGNYSAHLTLGQLCFVKGRTEEAVTEFSAALDLFGRSFDAHNGLALCYAKLGRPELAEPHRRAAEALRSGAGR